MEPSCDLLFVQCSEGGSDAVLGFCLNSSSGKFGGLTTGIKGLSDVSLSPFLVIFCQHHRQHPCCFRRV